MTKNATKFTFDTHFDAGGSEKAQAERRSRKTYSAEEIDAIQRTARDDGRKDGDVRATQAVAASIGQVAAAVHAAIQAMDVEVERRSAPRPLAWRSPRRAARQRGTGFRSRS